MTRLRPVRCYFFFIYTATTEIYTLSLPAALPISVGEAAGVAAAAPDAARARRHRVRHRAGDRPGPRGRRPDRRGVAQDRKSTRLNSSHANISYAAFCLKKKAL